jgi:hypothetical protein
MYYLNNWTILEHIAPGGDVVMRLRGEVFGNPRYQSGGEVTVSALRSCIQEGDSISITTRSGSEYVLGRPNPGEADAMDRVLRHTQALGATHAAPHSGTKA